MSLTLRQIWIRTASAVADVVAPADCRACGGPLLQVRACAVCSACMADLKAEAEGTCNSCGERLAMEDIAGAGFSLAHAGTCEGCSTDPPQFARATAFAAYEGTLRKLIRLHKFEAMEELASVLGDLIAPVLRDVLQEQGSTGPWHVVAVPLFRKRRRYNQSEQIANAALRRLRSTDVALPFLPGHGALRRTRATQSQSHLTPTQRRVNVRGAFATTTDVTGWNVVLVDDVYTTGATVAECTRTLIAAGAARVRVITLARTQPERVARWEVATT